MIKLKAYYQNSNIKKCIKLEGMVKKASNVLGIYQDRFLNYFFL